MIAGGPVRAGPGQSGPTDRPASCGQASAAAADPALPVAVR